MSESTDKKYVSAFSLFSKSFNLVKENLGLFALVSSVPLLMNLLQIFGSDSDEISTGSSSASLSSVNWAAVLGVGAGIGVILLVASAVLQVMALRLEVDVAKGEKTSAGKLWEFARKYFFRMLGLGIVAGLVIAGGLLLLIVPGIIMITRYFFAPYVMVNENLGIMDSLKRSTELSKDNWGPIWSVIGVTLLISLIPSLILGRFGGIVAGLLGVAYSVAPALRYFEVKKAGPKTSAAPTSTN